MNRRMFLKTTAIGTTSLMLTGCLSKKESTSASQRQKSPNILIVNVDDMGYGDMSCHGNPLIKTPHLDRLHNQSIRFTQFHVAPMCTPTRGQLMTGVDALRNGSRWVGTENTHLRTDLPTMAEIFRDAGYHTGLFGKWHLGDNYPMRPQDRGFQEVVSFPQQEVGTVNDYWGNDYFDDIYIHNGLPQKYSGFCTDVWFNLAMDWMKTQTNQNRPFLCYIPTNVVHGPYYCEQQYRDRVESANLNKDVETFFGMLMNLDDNIGRLEMFLERQGLKDDTIIIFMTDNGATGGYNTYNAGMKGLKTHLWEGGHRVPCFIRWPNGNLRQPGDIKQLAQVQDLLPTLRDLAGIKASDELLCDGTSLAETLRGQNGIHDRMLVVQFQRRIEIQKWDACIMWGPWRLLNANDIDPNESKEKTELIKARRKNIHLELYNIDQDPHQDNDVLDQHPEIVSQMKTFYEQWWAKTEPQLSIPRPIVIGNKAENPTLLAPTAWAETYFTQMSNVLEGVNTNGTWNLKIETAGEYRIELSRWPKEADTAITQAASISYADAYVYGSRKTGNALPIRYARMKIADHDLNLKVDSRDKLVAFTVKLDTGMAQLKTWFLDEKNEQLCGAYYVYITCLAI